MLASTSSPDSAAPLFQLAAMDADLALANAHNNSAPSATCSARTISGRGPSSTARASYLRRTSEDTNTSCTADKRQSVSSVLLSQLASSLDPELHDPDDAFDVPSHVGLSSASMSTMNKSSTSSATAAIGGRRSRAARARASVVLPPPSSKGGGGLPGPLRKEAYRRARSCPLQTHAEQQRPNFRDAHYDSLRCLQVPPCDDLLHRTSGGGHFETKGLQYLHSKPTSEVENRIPLASQIASSVYLTDAELSERSAALNFILTNPAHFRQLQSDLRSSSVITTHCSSVVLDQLLSERVARMRQVREEALFKIREERDREREYARQMGIPLDDDEEDGIANRYGTKSHGNGKGTTAKVGWDHLLAGLTSVANLGAGFLNKQSSTPSDEQKHQHHQSRSSYTHSHPHSNSNPHRVHDGDDGMAWNIDQPTNTATAATAPKRPSSTALEDINTGGQTKTAEQDKKTSLTTVAETLSFSSSGDLSLGGEDASISSAVLRKASLDSAASYSLSSKSPCGDGPTTKPTAVRGRLAHGRASAKGATRRGGRRRSLVARGA